MKISVLFFGSLKEATQKDNLQLDQVHSIQALEMALKKKYPSIVDHPYKVAVNETIVNKEHPLKDGDEVALLPPFAGG